LESTKDYDWSLEEHLEELRQRLFICFVLFAIAFALSFFLTPPVLIRLEALAPKGTVFFQLKPGELLFVYLHVSFILSVILSSPFLLFQIGSFIWPGLKKQEKMIALILFSGAPFLFFGAMAFAYFIALKPILNFILGFGVDLSLVQPQYSLDYFVSLVLSIICIFGISFQLPVLLYIAALLGLTTSYQLSKFWKEAILSAFVLAAFLTPTPDPINMSILGLALSGLYGLSWILIRLSGK
jgi:sec-independent protein translocase protein TatC